MEGPADVPVYPYNEVRPRLGERVFIAPGAMVVGDVAARSARHKDENRDMLVAEAG